MLAPSSSLVAGGGQLPPTSSRLSSSRNSARPLPLLQAHNNQRIRRPLLLQRRGQQPLVSSSSTSSTSSSICSSSQRQHQQAPCLPLLTSSSSSCRDLRPLHRQQQQQQRRRAVRAAAAAQSAAEAAAYEPSSSSSSSTSQHQQQQQQQQHTQPQPAAALDDALSQLELPPSRSAALWLSSMSDAELQQTADDWGYVQVGRPLPEGVSLTAIADTLPEEVFALDLPKALGYLGLSLGVMALGYSYLAYWHAICPAWQQLLAWVVIGTGYYGAFQTAVDCAHFVYWPERPLLQDALGALLMAPALISYELYRLKYFNHIMCTNQLQEDTDAWHPLLPSDLAAMPPWRATLTALLMATPLKFFASVGQWARSLEGFDLRLHPKATRFWVWLSWALPLGFVATVWPALVAAGGLGGLVTYWLGPWLVFHAWLSVMSLVQHTGPHITWAEEGLTYDQAQATINGTVSVQLPRWLEVLLHHSNHHLPTHVSISIPSYNLPAAQAYLQQKLGRYLTLATLNANLLRNLMTAWLVYDEQRQRYVSFDEAAPLVDAARQQQEQQRERDAAAAAAAAASRQAAAAAAAAASSGGEEGAAAGAGGSVISASIPLEKLLSGSGSRISSRGSAAGAAGA